jgi:hypothetical protein
LTPPAFRANPAVISRTKTLLVPFLAKSSLQKARLLTPTIKKKTTKSQIKRNSILLKENQIIDKPHKVG